MWRRSRDGRIHPAAAFCPPGIPAFPTAGPRIRRARAPGDAHYLKHDLITFPPSDPKPALPLHQMHPKGKGKRAAERCRLRSNRLPFPCVYGLYIDIIFRYSRCWFWKGSLGRVPSPPELLEPMREPTGTAFTDGSSHRPSNRWGNRQEPAVSGVPGVACRRHPRGKKQPRPTLTGLFPRSCFLSTEARAGVTPG